MTKIETIAVGRRTLMKSSGALMLAFALPGAREAEAAAGVAAAQAQANLTGYLMLNKDGTATVLSPTSEVGQGTHTAHAAIVADEVGLDIAKVSVRAGFPGPAMRRGQGPMAQMSTGGSWGVRSWIDPLRKAGAQARAMLAQAAADQWKVPVGEVTIANGEAVHGPSGKKIAVGKLVEAAAKIAPPDAPSLRDKREYKYVGNAKLKRLDIPAKARGEAKFAFDQSLPGMVYACAKLVPTFRGEVAGFDDAETRKVKGVTDVIAIPHGLAVVAKSSWAALQGAEKLKITAKAHELDALDSAKVSAALADGMAAASAPVAKNEGDVEAAFKAAAKIVEADYEVPYLAHTPMEPWSATVKIEGEAVDIWAPTQGQDRVAIAAAQALGLKPENIRVHTPYVGGGFGRRLQNDGVAGAALVAKAVGKPVKFFYTRDDDTASGFFRPAQAARMKAALDKNGQVTAISMRVVGPSLAAALMGRFDDTKADFFSTSGLTDSRYKPANLRVENAIRHNAVTISAWRAVGATHNGFFLEAFVDEIAAAANKDPVALRRELAAKDPRALKVIDTAAEKGEWGKPLPKGRARGFAYFESYGSLCAQVAEVSLENGVPKVHKVVCVLDCGSVVLPDGAKSQVEGGVIMGLSAALYEQASIAKGALVERNFDAYRILRMKEAPPIVEAHFIESGEAMGGVGEPPTPPAFAAVVNALATLTGKRVRKLPVGDQFNA
jgi:isoquinoline 1-oxidoreductase beta subunit